jgi:hypothetical protein
MQRLLSLTSIRQLGVALHRRARNGTLGVVVRILMTPISTQEGRTASQALAAAQVQFLPVSEVVGRKSSAG